MTRFLHLYIHVPFCAKICPYCAFYVHGGSRQKQIRFVEALAREAQIARDKYDWKFETLYIGGGTPSMLSADLFERMIDGLSLPATVKEFSIEVNPATVTTAKARAWKKAGVNRISLGAQSFNARFLKLLGRQHQPKDIGETVVALRCEGFDNVGLDLMYALPEMTLDDWKSNLESAIALQPQHLSAYALTYEERTPFYARAKAGQWKLDEENESAMFQATHSMLAAAGIEQYEISNYARPEWECQHNRAYWTGADYLGLGPSACSTMGSHRWKVIADTDAYIECLAHGKPVKVEEEVVTPEIRNRERIMFGLRMNEGVALEKLSGHERSIEMLLDEKLACIQHQHLKLTLRGQLVGDSIAALFGSNL